MVIYDWRVCPSPVPDIVGPADYGPLAIDQGQRAVMDPSGTYGPSPFVDLNPQPRQAEPKLCWILAAVAAALLLGK